MATRVEMKRVHVLGPGIEEILPLVEKSGLTLVSETPDVVLTWGGDGLLLHSEREWPGVPKLPLRNSRHGKKCEPAEIPEALDRLVRGDVRRRAHMKVRVEAGGTVQVGLNDIIMHNARPTSSVRYRVWIDGREFGDEIVGDGVVVATPFGSTAYYRSITRGIFRLGLGIAFNNSTEQIDHIVLPEDAVIRVRITRGPAVVAADNNHELIRLEDEDEIVVRRNEERAVVLSLR